MKLKILCIIISLMIVHITYAQNNFTFYDVVKLNSDIDNTTGHFSLNPYKAKDWITILNRYLPADEQTDPKKLVIAYTNNTFISKYFPSPEELSKRDTTRVLILGSSPFISTVGGLNVTSLADGLAKFLVKRLKDELTISFFKQFKDTLNNSRELKTIFPQTFKVLMTIDKNGYQYSIYLNTLQEGFVNDLAALYTNFKKAVQLPRIQSYLNKPEHLAVKTIINNAFYFTDEYIKGTHPGYIIANYKPDDNLYFNNANVQLNIRSSIKVLQLISTSLKSTSSKNYWVSADSVKDLLQNKTTQALYLGLLVQGGTADTFHTAKGNYSFSQLLNSPTTSADIFTNYIDELANDMQDADDKIVAANTRNTDMINYTDYYATVNTSADILQKGLSFHELPVVNIDDSLKEATTQQINKWISVLRASGELYMDVNNKNYSSAIINVTTIIDSIGDSNNKTLSDNILKYGSFASVVAKAQNSDDVENAIEAISLPVGSYNVKRESAFNISLNAYAGIYGGYEYMPALKTNQWAFSSGVAAPVGIAFSWGKIRTPFWENKKNNPGGKSFSIFVPLIDIGALAAFRLNDDSSKVVPNITLANIVSPGLYFYWGFGNCPVSIGLGGQFGPQLRSITSTDINISKNYYFRFGINIAVDIPVLNFRTRAQ
jgi:hypothetical protein